MESDELLATFQWSIFEEILHNKFSLTLRGAEVLSLAIVKILNRRVR
jgi:hypothetical protein